MSKLDGVFCRTEKKYILTREIRNRFLLLVKDRFEPAAYGESLVMSTYFDADDFRMIRLSIEKEKYKEKVRLRSYGVPDEDGDVFFELKKKCKGIVYKRRSVVKYAELLSYVETGTLPRDEQILKEIDYSIRFHGCLKPKALISYCRTAYVSKEERELRMTFDTNICARFEDALPHFGEARLPVLDKEYVLMELKALGNFPLWLTEALNELKIYPASFSKYGTAYKKYIKGVQNIPVTRSVK